MSARAALRRERPMRTGLPGWRPTEASARRPVLTAPPVLPAMRSAPSGGAPDLRSRGSGDRPAPRAASAGRAGGAGVLASIALHGTVLAAGIALAALMPNDPLARGGTEAIPVEFILVGEEDRQASQAAVAAPIVDVPMPEIAEHPEFPPQPVADFAVPISEAPPLRAADFAPPASAEPDLPAPPEPAPLGAELRPKPAEPQLRRQPPAAMPARPKPAAAKPARPMPRPAPRNPAAAADRPAPASIASVRGGTGGTQATAGNADIVNSYARQVLAHLARQKRYPAALRDRGVTGTVRVSFTIDGSGAVRSVSLAGSSGAAPLDEEALAMARRASPFPPIPPEAGRTLMAFTGSVRFDLRDF